MAPILPPQNLKKHLDINFHHESSWRNIESSWNALWLEIFRTLMGQIPLSHQHLIVTTEFGLVQWGITRDNTIALKFPPPPSSTPSTATGLQAQQSTRRALDESGSVSFDEQEYLAPKWLKYPDTTPGSYNTRSSRSQDTVGGSSTTPGNILTPSSPSATTVPSTAADPTPITPIKSPAINETRTAMQGKDSSFRVDMALYSISDPKPNSNIDIAFDHNAELRDTIPALILELKAVPSRSMFKSTSGGMFSHHLNMQLYKAYKDIHMKAPVVFLSHPDQKSLIGVAASGHWWSFACISQSDSEVYWSPAYVCGNEQHDNLFRKLFSAAHQHPENPAQYEDGWIPKFLMKHHRIHFTAIDCMAPDSVVFDV
ncbi:hypothetical protein RSAG8_09005, partial [Rhizoctonia solani AG-8 WAC10335]